jgi:VWFA-related protein
MTISSLQHRLIRLATCAAFAATGLSASAQLTGQNKPDNPSGVTTLHFTSRLVVETVTAKDKKGNFINGLTTKDFTLTEDGVPQVIRYCDHQTSSETLQPLPPTPTGAEDIKIYNRLAHGQISSETPGQLRYKDRRLMAFYFDMSAMQDPADQLRALSAAEKFIRTQMTSADLVSIMRYAGSSVDVLQDFTDDRNRLLSILETMIVGEGQGDTATSSDDASADTGAAFGQDDGEFNIFTTDRQLAALQTAAELLEHLSEKKELVYFASGMTLSGMDNQAQLNATEQAALRAGVAIWAIDARGLVASGPMGDATHGSPGGASMYTGGAAMAMTSRREQSQDTMYALAGDTGGKALFDNNDLSVGIVNAQKSVSNYYILEYYTTNNTPNGKFRKVNVTLNNGALAKLDFRQGYYGEKEWGKFNTADKERQLEDALMQGDPFTELTVAMEINYFQLNRAEYFVPIMMKVPGRELALAKKSGAEKTSIDFVGEIKDDYGNSTVTNIREHIEKKLTDETAAQWAKVPIEYSTGYTLEPGKYTIKVLARDDETGRLGTFQTTFVIPNLNKEVARVPISSVVLSNERQANSDAIYNVANRKEQAKEAAVNPLMQGGLQIIPSVNRVFTKARTLTVFLQAYDGTRPAVPASIPAQPTLPTAPTAKPLIAYVSFYQGQNKVYETQPEEVSPNPNTRLQIAGINFNVNLGSLTPGRYDCQVTVLDPTAGKTAFWTAPIMIVP